MFGNKYAGSDIASEMYKLLNKSKSNPHKKAASKEDGKSSLKAEALANPEDFLVAPETTEPDVGADLESKISDMSSYAEDPDTCKNHAIDEQCSLCDSSMAMDGLSPGSMLAQNFADDSDKEEEEEDISYLVDARAKVVLEGLGKIAKSLYNKNEDFAGDLVEATAMGIRKDYLKKAAKKIKVINSLNKMASDFYSNGNDLAGDMVTVTIDKIKKNS